MLESRQSYPGVGPEVGVGVGSTFGAGDRLQRGRLDAPPQLAFRGCVGVEHLLERVDQVDRIERLGDVAQRPFDAPPHLELAVVERGDEKHRDLRARIPPGLELGQHRPAVDARHHEVEEHRVGRVAAHPIECFLARSRR